jgi:hypothetical protein
MATDAARRSESRFEVSPEQLKCLERLLCQFGKVVSYDKRGVSSIVSFYYECLEIKLDTNASIRQRTYLAQGLDEFLMLPCVVDAKVNLAEGPQLKWRRSYPNWMVAHAHLTAPVHERPQDMFPELVHHYGGLSSLSIPYGVMYRRRYFSLPGGARATLDGTIQILNVDSSLKSSIAHTLPHSILEIKRRPEDSSLPAEFSGHLTALSLAWSNSKRAHARAVVKLTGCASDGNN